MRGQKPKLGNVVPRKADATAPVPEMRQGRAARSRDMELAELAARLAAGVSRRLLVSVPLVEAETGASQRNSDHLGDPLLRHEGKQCTRLAPTGRRNDVRTSKLVKAAKARTARQGCDI
ncbi:hypothetical protein [Rhodovulum sulfidophilum]|uniref:hypothetical protein n=1 Tax=Rhodovulum sulfidophilum TaxID=35806 RepID=UPI00095174E4|nr:hypothetical protein [Rhodovulum sulfidophilum]MBL3552270.1 hypothetical protein [Rhodovulum sulfidophilum]OLS49778.1 hypothetical protein BV379_16850 [Rhodovulum sulfidophilum]